MAVTDLKAEPPAMSQIIVPATTQGLEIVRAILVMGHRGRGWSTHCEVRSPAPGSRWPTPSASPGTASASPRSGSAPAASTTHARWLGQMQRARADVRLRTPPPGVRRATATKQTVQTGWPTRRGRDPGLPALTLDAAARIDQGEEARVEISAVKFYAARVLHDVIDRAVQVHGALGLTDQTLLARMYADARAARLYDGPDEVHRMVVSRRVLRAFEQGAVWDFAQGGPCLVLDMARFAGEGEAVPPEQDDDRERQLAALRRYCPALDMRRQHQGQARAVERRRPAWPWLLLTLVLMAVSLAGGVAIGANRDAVGNPARYSGTTATSVALPRRLPRVRAEAVEKANKTLSHAVRVSAPCASTPRP